MSREYLGIIALTSLFTLSVLGWGGLLSRIGLKLDTFWQNLAVRVITGYCALYALFILLSLAGRLHRLEVAVVISLGTLLSCAEIPDLARSISTTLAGVRNWTTADRALLSVIGVCVALHMAYGLTPLMFYDSQAYLLLAPAEFLKSGGLTHILWNAQSNTPLAMQLIVGMSLSLDASGQTAKLLLTLAGCLAAAGAYEFIRPAGRRAALLAVLCILCFPEFLMMQTFGTTDLGVAGMMIFGAIWTRQALMEGSWRTVVPAGLAFGLAIGSRYQAVVLVSLVVAVFLAEAAFARKVSVRTGGQLFAMGCLVTLLVAPWLVRNYVHLGNPVFPLMQSVWRDSGEWSSEQAQIWTRGVFGPSFWNLSIVQQVLAPVAALLPQPANGLFGIGLVLGALMGLFVSKQPIRLAALLGLSGLVIWGLVRPGAGLALLRYNALSLIFLLAATGAVLGSEWIPSKAGTTIALTLSGGSLLMGLVHVQSVLPAAQSLVNPAARQAIYRANVPSWEAFEYLNTKLDPARDKVLLIGETRAFWVNVPYIAPSAFNGPQLDAILGGDSNPDDWTKEFSRLRLTHLLLSNSEIERWHKQYNYLNIPKEQVEKFNSWLKTLTKEFDDGRGNVVLGLQPETK